MLHKSEQSMETRGDEKLNWVADHMPLLTILEKQFVEKKPFHNLTIAVCIHLEAKTARLAEILSRGGANVLLSSSNTLSTQDDVAAAIAKRGIQDFAKHGCSEQDYEMYLHQMLQKKPHIILDDGETDSYSP